VIIPDIEERERVECETGGCTANLESCTTCDRNLIESRLSSLESSIEELKQLIFQKDSISQGKLTNKALEKAEVGIQTRVVASTGRALFDKCTSIWPSLHSTDSPSSLMLSNLLSQNYVPNSSFNSSFNSYSNNNLSLLHLEFTQDELETYSTSRKVGLSRATIPWTNKAAAIFWNSTKLSKVHQYAAFIYQHNGPPCAL